MRSYDVTGTVSHQRLEVLVNVVHGAFEENVSSLLVYLFAAVQIVYLQFANSATLVTSRVANFRGNSHIAGSFDAGL